jgi:hypothetical protein
MELTLKRWTIWTASLAIIAGAIYWFVGPIVIPDVEVIGSLQPGNSPTPPNVCGPGPFPDNAIAVLIGDNALVHLGAGKFRALAIGECDAISMEQTSAGVRVYADLYDANGKLVARIANGEIHTMTGENVRQERNGDLSVLIIKDRHGSELLNIRYLNPKTIQVRGIFGCPGHPPVIVRDQQPVPGLFIRGSCVVNMVPGKAAGLHIN